MQPKFVKNVLLFIALQAMVFAFSINYIEDPDSMRFALAVYDYDLALLQPHFPGYAVFCFLAQVLHLLFGKLSLTFACIGGVSIYIIFDMSCRILKPQNLATELLIVICLSVQPLILLTATRYMPDLLGASIAFVCVLNFVRSRNSQTLLLTAFLLGLLTGVRLSNLPIVLLPFLWALYHSPQKMRLIFAGIVGVAVWLIPLTILTGPSVLYELAQQQSSGHFSEFGGTIDTIPDYAARFSGMWQSIWADGLGSYWPGRSLYSLLPTVGVVLLLGVSLQRLLSGKLKHCSELWLVIASCCLYLIWIFLYQNVVHKPRHVLPIIPFLGLGLLYGAQQFLNSPQTLQRLIPYAYALALSVLSLVLVNQHRSPSAMAQAAEHLRAFNAADKQKVLLISTELVCTFMRRQGIDVECLSVDPRQAQTIDIASLEQGVFVIGEQSVHSGKKTSRDTVYYHNPFVNRMWPQVLVRQFPAQRVSRESQQ